VQASSIKDWQAIRHCKNKGLKSAVIRFSGFTRLSSSTCADNAEHLCLFLTLRRAFEPSECCNRMSIACCVTDRATSKRHPPIRTQIPPPAHQMAPKPSHSISNSLPLSTLHHQFLESDHKYLRICDLCQGTGVWYSGCIRGNSLFMQLIRVQRALGNSVSDFVRTDGICPEK
jgi:hypothetical protein